MGAPAMGAPAMGAPAPVGLAAGFLGGRDGGSGLPVKVLAVTLLGLDLDEVTVLPGETLLTVVVIAHGFQVVVGAVGGGAVGAGGEVTAGADNHVNLFRSGAGVNDVLESLTVGAGGAGAGRGVVLGPECWQPDGRFQP